MKSKKFTALSVSSAPQVGPTEPTPLIAANHRFFVGMYSGAFPSIAGAISEARLPPGTEAMGELPARPGSSKILVFRTPPGTTDAEDDLLILIVEPIADGKVSLWLSGTDLAREQREEAEDDIVSFAEVRGGEFKIFERL